MTKLTAEQRKNYIEIGGVRCPFCNSEEIESTDSFDGDADSCWQEMQCLNCEEEWTDYYKLIYVETEDDGE